MPTRPLCPQLLRGMYATYLKIWFQFFPRDSFLILNSVDFFEDNRATAKKVVVTGYYYLCPCGCKRLRLIKPQLLAQ